MKLKEYLKQFEGLDPELEVYKQSSNLTDSPTSCYRGELYDNLYKIGFVSHQILPEENCYSDPIDNSDVKVLLLG